MTLRLSIAKARRLGHRPPAKRKAAPAAWVEDAAAAMATRPPALRLAVELPPSANKSWRPGNLENGAPAMFKRGPFKDWLEAASFSVAAQAGGRRIPGPYALRIAFGEGAKDPDNNCKGISDALQRGGAIANDKHLRRLVLDVLPSGDRRTATVELWALAGGSGASPELGTTRPAPAAETSEASGRAIPNASCPKART